MSDTTAHFVKQFQRLNPAQQQAVAVIDGPVMVLAGPGTGKTQVLALRIANILLKTDTAPESILALTFTESAAKNMRSRLVSLIGKDAYYVQIETFHSFCSGVLQSHPEYFELARNSEPLTDFERFSVLESLLDSQELEVLKPRRAPYFYLKDVQKALSDLKREGVTPDTFEEIVSQELAALEAEQSELSKTVRLQREKNVAKQQELAQLYRAYQAKLHALAKFDYDDMVILVLRAFREHEVLLLEYQENILYFLVDEYQDTNTAQNAIVDVLASYAPDTANVFVVGDPNQAIYRFQGASLENVLGFLDRYPLATVIGLTIGYRCSQNIYTAAGELLLQNDSTTAQKTTASNTRLLTEFAKSSQLQSNHAGVLPLVLHQAPTQFAEVIFVAEKISALLATGVEPKNIAVLFRTNAESAVLIETCKKWDIPFKSDVGANVFETTAVSQLLQLLQVVEAVRRGVEADKLYHVLQFEWLGVPPLLVMQLSRAAHRARVGVFDLVARGHAVFMEHHLGQPVTPAEFSVVEKACGKLLEWANLDSRISFLEWYQTVQEESGFLRWVMKQPERVTQLQYLQAVYREVQALVKKNHNLKLAEFLLAVATMQDQGFSITLDSLSAQEDAVTLSTVHKAKGREWQYVFIVGLVDGGWGNSRKRSLLPLPDGILKNTDFSKKERNEDDRRLLFVALTRAKEQVFLSYPAVSITDNRSREMVPSMFLEELRAHCTESQSSESSVTAAQADSTKAEQLALFLSPAPTRSVSVFEREYLKHLVSEFKLSVSALNSYLHDPEEFLLRYILKVPSSPSVPLAFGTAVHSALEKLYANYLSFGRYPELSVLEHVFEQSLSKELVLTKDFKRELEHGKHVLQQYYSNLATGKPSEVVFVERFFGSGRSVPLLGDIVLTGRVDRVDWVDSSKKTTRVIDYKTGRVRSIGEITASTTTALQKLSPREQSLPAEIRGHYKRQLLFYKLLTDLDHTFEHTAVEGVFEFVEPDEKTGAGVSRVVTLDPAELELLKALIIEIMGEIRSLAFLSEA